MSRTTLLIPIDTTNNLGLIQYIFFNQLPPSQEQLNKDTSNSFEMPGKVHSLGLS